MSYNGAITVITHGGRRYVDTADLTKVCGVKATELDGKFRPMTWGMPRDFWWDGRKMWFAIASLGQLADELQKLNETDAALKLREWCGPWVAAVVAEEQKLSAGSGGAETSGSPKGLGCPTGITATPAQAEAHPAKPLWYQDEKGGMA